MSVEVLGHPSLGLLRKKIQQIEVFLFLKMESILVEDKSRGTSHKLMGAILMMGKLAFHSIDAAYQHLLFILSEKPLLKEVGKYRQEVGEDYNSDDHVHRHHHLLGEGTRRQIAITYREACLKYQVNGLHYAFPRLYG